MRCDVNNLDRYYGTEYEHTLQMAATDFPRGHLSRAARCQSVEPHYQAGALRGSSRFLSLTESLSAFNPLPSPQC